MVHLLGELIAPRALTWLTSAKEPRIHSVYRQSVNLFESKCGLLSIVLPDLGPGPFAIIVTPLEDRFGGFGVLEVNSPVVVRDRSILLQNVQIDTANASEWQPRPDWERFGQALTGVRIAQILVLLRQHAPPDSFAPLVYETAPHPEHSLQLKALRAAAGPAELLSDGLVKNDIGKVELAAEQLAGLGSGVTPSGDDYLQGAMHALWSCMDEHRAIGACAAIVRVAEPRTNAISAEWLRAAARGDAAGDWHRLAESVNSGHGVDEAAIQLIHRGHTSGADALAGFVAIASAMIGPRWKEVGSNLA